MTKFKALFANALLFPKSDVDLNSRLSWTRLYMILSYDMKFAYGGKAKNLENRIDTKNENDRRIIY